MQPRCLWYCKSTIFQANHNRCSFQPILLLLFVILQKYDFSSKSQRLITFIFMCGRCLWYCKSTIFQANHNRAAWPAAAPRVVCDTAKVRFFKQITTYSFQYGNFWQLFVILQKYDFSSKSQHFEDIKVLVAGCLWYCKSTIFQANHNC